VDFLLFGTYEKSKLVKKYILILKRNWKFDEIICNIKPNNST